MQSVRTIDTTGLDWALFGEDLRSLAEFDPGETQKVDGEGWSGWLDKTQIREGIALYRMAGKIKHSVRLLTSDEARRDTLGLVLPLTAPTRYKGAGFRRWVQVRAGHVLTNTTAERWAWMAFPPHADFRIGAMTIDADALQELIGHPASWRELQTMASSSCLCDIRPGAGGTLHAMSELLASPHVGRLGHLHREARVLDLIAHHFDRLLGGAGHGELPAAVVRKVAQARECLDANLKKPPSLSELGTLVGLDTKRLNQGFRQLYGTTAFDYLRGARLDAAHRLIGDYPHLPLKAIAWRVGYRHVSNFCTAYHRRFGHPPRQRKS